MTAKSPDNIRAGELRTALFAGSFDPFTIGHASIVSRALPLFDRIVIAVGVNMAKTSADEVSRRVEAIAALYAGEPRVTVTHYEGLTVDMAARCGARWLLRGVRSVKDFEYERDMADINRQLSGLETVLLYSLPEHAAVSSSIVRELRAYGRDVSDYLPGK